MSASKTGKVRLCGVAAVVAGSLAVCQAPARAATCEEAVTHTAATAAVPEAILRAIAVVESGRWNDERQRTQPWPWSVNADGQSLTFPDKAQAIAAVDELRKKGAQDIDVGCMQVSLMAHPKAFADLDTAFDPAANVAYAAKFLTDLKGQYGQWLTAVGHYHSKTPNLSTAYAEQVMEHLDGSVDSLRGSRPAMPTEKKPAQIQTAAAMASVGKTEPGIPREDVAGYCGTLIASLPDRPALGSELCHAVTDEAAGKAKDARDTYLKVLAAAPDEVFAHVRLLRLVGSGQADLSEDDLVASYRDQPFFPALLVEAARIAALSGNRDRAQAYLVAAASIKPDDPAVLLDLAVFRDASQDADDAVRLYSAYLERGDDTVTPAERGQIEARIAELRVARR